MTKKTYRTFFLKSLAIRFKDDADKQYEAIFRGGIQIDSTARLTTANKTIQDYLENCPLYGKDFYLESEVDLEEKKAEAAPAPKKAEPEKPVMENVKDIKRFHNIVEMRNYMAEIGIEGVEKMNYAQAKSAAAKEGYDFQIQK